MSPPSQMLTGLSGVTSQLGQGEGRSWGLLVRTFWCFHRGTCLLFHGI